jgi:spore maturation protein B
MAIMRSFSGGGTSGMMAELLELYGTQSQIGRIASVAVGSTETTFYIIAVYFGSVGVSNSRHSVAAGLLGDLASLLAAVFIVNLMWF